MNSNNIMSRKFLTTEGYLRSILRSKIPVIFTFIFFIGSFYTTVSAQTTQPCDIKNAAVGSLFGTTRYAFVVIRGPEVTGPLNRGKYFSDWTSTVEKSLSNLYDLVDQGFCSNAVQTLPCNITNGNNGLKGISYIVIRGKEAWSAEPRGAFFSQWRSTPALAEKDLTRLQKIGLCR
jgi:hypothetical protein